MIGLYKQFLQEIRLRSFYDETELKRRAEEFEENQKARKERLAMEMALSCSSATGLMRIFQSVFGKSLSELPSEYKGMVSSSLAAEATTIKPKDLCPELRELAGAQGIQREHRELADRLDFSDGVSFGYSIGDLKSLFQDRVRAMRTIANS